MEVIKDDNGNVIGYKEEMTAQDPVDGWADELIWLSCPICGCTFSVKKSALLWDNNAASLLAKCPTSGCPNKIKV